MDGLRGRAAAAELGKPNVPSVDAHLTVAPADFEMIE